MRLPIPVFMAKVALSGLPVSHTWSQTDAMIAVGSDNAARENSLSALSPRSLLGLSATLAEWLQLRFATLTADDEFVHLIEATWAASIDFQYLRRDALDFAPNYKNPVRGPRQEGKRLLAALCSAFRSVDYGMVRYVGNLASLTHYVLPDGKPFQAWMKAAIAGLAGASAPSIEHSGNLPVSQIKVEPRGSVDAIWGEPVPREAFDPAFNLGGADRDALIDALLVTIAATPNPFLRIPAELAAAGFTGKPYRYPAS